LFTLGKTSKLKGTGVFGFVNVDGEGRRTAVRVALAAILGLVVLANSPDFATALLKDASINSYNN
jgi:hypothetical protein